MIGGGVDEDNCFFVTPSPAGQNKFPLFYSLPAVTSVTPTIVCELADTSKPVVWGCGRPCVTPLVGCGQRGGMDPNATTLGVCCREGTSKKAMRALLAVAMLPSEGEEKSGESAV